MKIDSFIPSGGCFKCHNFCCRFRADEQSYAPLLTEPELKNIKKRYHRPFGFKIWGKEKNVFQLKLVKSRRRNLYLCPFFDEAKKLCRIHFFKPFDCLFWPYVLMKKKKNELKTVACYGAADCEGLRRKKSTECRAYERYLKKTFARPANKKWFKEFPGMFWDYDPGAKIIFGIKE
jgi:Fe-S-cluster containining protein